VVKFGLSTTCYSRHVDIQPTLRNVWAGNVCDGALHMLDAHAATIQHKDAHKISPRSLLHGMQLGHRAMHA
jgi:hypothetical protein